MKRSEKIQAEHAAISAHHAKLAKLHRDDGEHQHAAEHHGLAARHAALVKHCASASKADSGTLQKDAGLRDLVQKMVSEAIANTVKPTGVHGAIPSHPDYVLAPRHGQRAVGGATLDSTMAKIIGTDEGSMHSEELTLIGR